MMVASSIKASKQLDCFNNHGFQNVNVKMTPTKHLSGFSVTSNSETNTKYDSNGSSEPTSGSTFSNYDGPRSVLSVAGKTILSGNGDTP